MSRGQGWYNESRRHSLAARGVRTMEARGKYDFGHPRMEDWEFPSEKDAPKVGMEIWFEYHCTESEESCDAELWHHTHQKAKIIKVYSPEEVDFPLYRVRFKDGFEGDVTIDELLKDPRGFYRPDYKPRKVDR